MKFIKSNIGFIIGMMVLAIIALNPEAKSFVLKGLIKSGLYEPDFVPAINTGQAAVPSAVFRSATGEQIDISDAKGKVIFVNFWAKWCPPCLAEMPSINKLSEHFKDEKDLLFVMVNVDGELQASDEYFQKNSYRFPAYAPTGILPDQIFKATLPTTVIINKDGEIAYLHGGLANYNSEKTRDFIQRLLME